MRKNSVYPVFMVENVGICRAFFVKYFGYQDTFVADWYISMKDAQNNELAFLQYNHESVPEGLRNKSTGILLNIELDNVEKAYAILYKNLVDSIVLPLKEEDFGQKHFIIRAPENILVDVIENIAPSEEYAKYYE